MVVVALRDEVGGRSAGVARPRDRPAGRTLGGARGRARAARGGPDDADTGTDTDTDTDYEIGEDHPGIHESDAVFEARRALELGSLELVLGRLSSRQLAGYRLLVELTLPYVDGERFTDAAGSTETNAAVHDYLFTQTGNEHLLRAYQALGVRGQMEETLRTATWCDPRCATDHVEIVDAIETGDRDAARTLITDHAERSKVTMRRAMDDTFARKLVAAGQDDVAVAAPMVVVFLLASAWPSLGRWLPPILAALVVGVAALAVGGGLSTGGDGGWLASPVATAPEFTWPRSGSWWCRS